MQISFLGQGRFKIKTKSGTIITGEEIKINDLVISGSGEYEVSGIEAEVIDNISIFHTEDLDLVYLDKRQKPLTDKEVEKINGVNVLFVPVGGGEVFNPKEALEVINQIEPKIVIPMYYDNISDFSRLEGISIKNMDILKLAKTDLDEEERRIVVLNVSN